MLTEIGKLWWQYKCLLWRYMNMFFSAEVSWIVLFDDPCQFDCAICEICYESSRCISLHDRSNCAFHSTIIHVQYLVLWQKIYIMKKPWCYLLCKFSMSDRRCSSVYIHNKTFGKNVFKTRIWTLTLNIARGLKKWLGNFVLI